MKSLAILLIAGALAGPAFAEPRSANAHPTPAPRMASYKRPHKAETSSRVDADGDFDNDIVQPEYGNR